MAPNHSVMNNANAAAEQRAEEENDEDVFSQNTRGVRSLACLASIKTEENS
jgi:hypothetical protein